MINWCEEHIEFIKLIISVIAMIGGAIALVFQYKRTKSMEETAKASFESININREDNIAQRFAKAIEHLGSEQNAIKLGGIHSLHQIAKEHSETYREQVADILCSYIRETYPVAENPEDNKPVDVISQTILNLITSETFEAIILDLNNSNLKRAKLDKANLQGANLQRADLREVNLQGAKLKGADLREVNLQGAKLQGAKLQEADLRGADLRVADFMWADLQEADLRGADLRGAKLRGADLMWADLQEAKLNTANLQNANLQNANFLGANLQNARFLWADLQVAKNIDTAVNIPDNIVEEVMKYNETKD